MVKLVHQSSSIKNNISYRNISTMLNGDTSNIAYAFECIGG